MPPFVATFRPAEPLRAFTGSDPNGTWRLVVVDQTWLDSGELVAWGLDVPTAEEGDHGHPIDVVVTRGLTATQVAAFDEAAAAWSSVLLASAPSVLIGGDLIDGVRIEASGVQIDGPQGILGQAGPIAVRPGSLIPATGVMRFATGDLATMELHGSLVDVIVHEIGHVLGVGTLWKDKLLVRNSGTTNPTFVGTRSMEVFAELIQAEEPTPVPIANSGGAGTREGHWRESVFGNELMTGSSATANPLSRLTIASLADIGYEATHAPPIPTGCRRRSNWRCSAPAATRRSSTVARSASPAAVLASCRYRQKRWSDRLGPPASGGRRLAARRGANSAALSSAPMADRPPPSSPIGRWFDEVGTRRRYPAQSFLFHEGDPSAVVLLVETGMLRIERTTPQGRRVLFDIATVGDLVGELGAADGTRRSNTVSTMTESRVLVVDAASFHDRLDSDAPFTHAVLRKVVSRLRELSDQFVEATSPGAAGRVAARVVRLVEATADDEEEPIELVLPFSQEELAQWAGLSREGTVKGLRELREAGVLETGRRRLTILDVTGLRRYAKRTGRN